MTETFGYPSQVFVLYPYIPACQDIAEPNCPRVFRRKRTSEKGYEKEGRLRLRGDGSGYMLWHRHIQ